MVCPFLWRQSVSQRIHLWFTAILVSDCDVVQGQQIQMFGTVMLPM